MGALHRWLGALLAAAALAAGIAPEAVRPREAFRTRAGQGAKTGNSSAAYVSRAGSTPPVPLNAGGQIRPSNTAVYAERLLAWRSLYPMGMTTRGSALFGLLLATAPLARTTAQDRDEYAHYAAELRALAAKDAPAATSRTAKLATAPSPCPFLTGTATGTSSQDCMSCHGLHQTHPVDIDYAQSAQRRPNFFRPPEEVVRRGVFLPEGQVKCSTCHDPHSSWKYRLALPPGAVARRAVNLADPATFERSRHAAEAAPPPGSSVTPTPLCLSCHAYD